MIPLWLLLSLVALLVLAIAMAWEYRAELRRVQRERPGTHHVTIWRSDA